MNITTLNQAVRTTVFTIASIAATATATMPGASVVGTGVAMTGLMAISSPAMAAQCKGVAVGKGTAKAFSNKAGIRRAKRRAIRNWKSEVKDRFGRNFADFDDARNVRFLNCEAVKGSGGQSGFQRCTVRATACNG